MNDQILIKAPTLCDFHIATPQAHLEQPIYASSRDYGFDFDEDELARDMLAPLPAGENQATLSLDADEFCNLCFLA